jgi:uncharacterized protein
LLPVNRIQIRITGNKATPVWLGAEDHAWLRALIDDFLRLGGRPYHEVASFIREPSRVPSPGGKRRMAVCALQNMCDRQRPPFNAGAIRDAVAVAAQLARDAGRFERSEAVAEAAKRLGLHASIIDDHLFSDLPGERHLSLPVPMPDPHALAAHTNLELAQGLLRLASEVNIELYGSVRAVVRQVHLQRLICTVRRGKGDGVRLEISGAFTLFRHTTLYGRALASILPPLSWCERFELIARCRLRGQSVSIHLRSGDPITLGEPPRLYDSRLEERFAREFAKATLDWDLVREPEPVESGETLVFPDFAVIHRRDSSRHFLLEIVGFWTRDYLRNKLNHLRSISCAPLILCINQALNCGAEELPAHAGIVWFNKRIDPRAVLDVIETVAGSNMHCR